VWPVAGSAHAISGGGTANDNESREKLMTRGYIVLIALALLLAGGSGIALTQSVGDKFMDFGPPSPQFVTRGGGHDHGGADDEGDDELGDMIAGTWLGRGQFALDLECDGIPDAEPTMFDFDSQSFTASGFYAATNPNNPLLGHGAWKQTGMREVTSNNIVYLTNPETGALDFILRIPGVFTFNPSYTTATSTFGAIGYLPTQDPLDPDEVPVFCTIGEHYELRKVMP
jgi:hypothetical protein